MIAFQTLESFFTQISDIHLPTLIVSSIAIVLILFVKIVPDPILVRKYVDQNREVPRINNTSGRRYLELVRYRNYV